ncbi:hypothetical protein ACU686_32635 [Yinghuangia aomiensis]
MADQALANLHVDLLILGTHGVSERAEAQHPQPRRRQTNRALIAAARRVAVVADHSKWGVAGLAGFAALDTVDVFVTDDGIPTAARARPRGPRRRTRRGPRHRTEIPRQNTTARRATTSTTRRPPATEHDGAGAPRGQSAAPRRRRRRQKPADPPALMPSPSSISPHHLRRRPRVQEREPGHRLALPARRRHEVDLPGQQPLQTTRGSPPADQPRRRNSTADSPAPGSAPGAASRGSAAPCPRPASVPPRRRPGRRPCRSTASENHSGRPRARQVRWYAIGRVPPPPRRCAARPGSDAP